LEVDVYNTFINYRKGITIILLSIKDDLRIKFSVFLVFFMPTCFLSACTPNRVVPDNFYRQHYVDATQKYYPDIAEPVKQAVFAHVNRDAYRDLLLLSYGKKEGEAKIQVLVNRDGKRFDVLKGTGALKTLRGNLLFLSAGDLDGDRVDDLVFIEEKSGSSQAQVLFNNKKGYYYRKTKSVFPQIFAGMERIDLIDLDQDGDRDLFFTGRKVLQEDGSVHKFQAQLLVNNGKGEFKDLTKILMPSLPAGINGASFADYDGDGITDVFLTYDVGGDRLLLNNGLARFEDKTRNALPLIPGGTAHADWADFDQDGDNDLLIARKLQAKSRTASYFLENDGKGHFKKRGHKILPRSPSAKVFLLDANGNKWADALILSRNGTHLFHGKGKWSFTDETDRRLPRSRQFRDMSFGDINDDGILDVFAISRQTNKGRIWLNVFD
jgi:hypothetical protein